MICRCSIFLPHFTFPEDSFNINHRHAILHIFIPVGLLMVSIDIENVGECNGHIAQTLFVKTIYFSLFLCIMRGMNYNLFPKNSPPAFHWLYIYFCNITMDY